MKSLKPNQRVALLAASLAILSAVTPLLIRTWHEPGQDRVLGVLPSHFVEGLLIGAIGGLLIVVVSSWLRMKRSGGSDD